MITYDPLQVENDDGFLYCVYRIECLPVKTISLAVQIATAKHLLSVIRKKYGMAEIVADIEELVDEP